MHIIAVEICSEHVVSPEVSLPQGHTCLSSRGLERAVTLSQHDRGQGSHPCSQERRIQACVQL